MSLSQPIFDVPAVFRTPPSDHSAPLRAFARCPIPIRPLLAAVAALGIGAPVAALFVPPAFSSGSPPIVTLVCVLAALAAPVFTFLTALQAQSAKTTRGAVGLTLLGCVAPPTALFALTLYGLVFAVPAGLLAFALVLPLVLGGRRVASTDSADALERVLVGASGWLAVIGAVTVGVARLGVGERAWGPLPLSLWGGLPLLAGVLFAAFVAARDLARLLVIVRARNASAQGLVLRAATDADGTLPRLSAGLLTSEAVVLERVTPVGEGAFRSSTTVETLGLVRAPWARFVVMSIVTLSAATTLLLLFTT